MKCPDCPIAPDQACLGETVPQLAVLCEWAKSPELRGRVAMRCALGWTEPRRIDPPPADPDTPNPAQGLPLAGDLVAGLTRLLGVDGAVKYVADYLGVDCGCPERREKLNRLDATVRKFLGIG